MAEYNYETAPRWYAVHTIARGEWLAHKALQEAGFDTLYLHYQGTVKHARRMIGVLKPLFPRYLFVAVRPWQSLYVVNNTPGVATVLYGADGPIEIPADAVDTLKARADEHGMVKPPKFGKSRVLFEPDDEVYIVDGPLRGFRAIVAVDTENQVKVWLDLFKGRVETTVAPSALRLVSPEGQRLRPKQPAG